MISWQEALDIILDTVKVLPVEQVPLLEGLDRTLAEQVVSHLDIPPFDNSAMDGYALRAEETAGASRKKPIVFEVLEDLPAGKIPRRQIKRGQAARIMTGAPIPRGANAVVMVESTEAEEDGHVKVFQEVNPGENVRPQGEDIAKGSVVLEVNTPLTPARIGLLASLGRAHIKVFQRPKAAILPTGDELLEVHQPPLPGKIYSSNSYTLISQTRKSGAESIYLGIARDRHETILRKINQGLKVADLLITSGGVSVGDYDLLKSVLDSMGLERKFWKVAIKPGMPTLFGVLHGKPVFSLPGNPVASMVTFELFVRPALLKMMGRKNINRPRVKAILDEDVKKKAGRVHLFRASVKYEDGRYHASTTGPQGSGQLKSMDKAQALMLLPEETTLLKKGQEVELLALDMVEAE